MHQTWLPTCFPYELRQKDYPNKVDISTCLILIHELPSMQIGDASRSLPTSRSRRLSCQRRQTHNLTKVSRKG